MYRLNVLFFAMTLIGCGSSAAQYAQKDFSLGRLFGFSDKRLADGVYLVRFEGTEGNAMPEIVDYVKRRAAELCGSPDFEAEIREFFRTRTNLSYDDPRGELFVTHPPFPTAEAQLKCKPQP